MADWTTMFDASLDVALGLGETQLGAIPAKRGVLALLADNDQPILLLTAADLRARLRTRLSEPLESVHRKSADLREITRKILWKLSHSHFETDLNYLELARTIWPRTYTEMLAYKPAWFVRVDPTEKHPHFVRTRGIGGLCVGPFESGQNAERFIKAVEDAFDLCRDYQCLRQAPHGPTCAYLQMGRCLGPCNGTIPLDEYRKAVARAAAFASGDRAELAQSLQARMKEEAAKLHFEQAAGLKARLDRLDEFNSPQYRHVAPLEQFRFILVQPGASRKRSDVFLVSGPTVLKAPPLDCPPAEPQLSQMLAAMADLASRPPAEMDEAGLWRMGLVAHYLFSGPRRAGTIIRWKPELTAADLVAVVSGLSHGSGKGESLFA